MASLFSAQAHADYDSDELWMDELLPELYETEKDPLYQKGHQSVSEGLTTFSESIDSFFSEPRMDVESNGTRLRMNNRLVLVDSNSEEFAFDLNFNLDLPNTRKKLDLIFLSLSEDLDESEDDENGAGGGSGEGADSPENSVEQQDYFAGLRLFLKQNKNFNISTDYGIKLVWPPDPFARIRARESVFVGEWEWRFTQNVFWFDSEGLGARLNADFDRRLSRGLLFRQANRASWRAPEGEINYGHSLNLFHTLSRKAGWAYSAGIRSNAPEDQQPTLQSYVVSARYRRNIYRNALFFEFRPFVAWPRSLNFGNRPGIIFNLQILFGPKYTRPRDVDFI
ncbi:MAG: hypothetical protein HRT45_12720 [Bdellovibrionales bacterium]|nr:hypothetical protein [Bdellovibrionales bacterium]